MSTYFDTRGVEHGSEAEAKASNFKYQVAEDQLREARAQTELLQKGAMAARALADQQGIANNALSAQSTTLSAIDARLQQGLGRMEEYIQQDAVHRNWAKDVRILEVASDREKIEIHLRQLEFGFRDHVRKLVESHVSSKTDSLIAKNEKPLARFRGFEELRRKNADSIDSLALRKHASERKLHQIRREYDSLKNDGKGAALDFGLSALAGIGAFCAVVLLFHLVGAPESAITLTIAIAIMVFTTYHQIIKRAKLRNKATADFEDKKEQLGKELRAHQADFDEVAQAYASELSRAKELSANNEADFRELYQALWSSVRDEAARVSVDADALVQWLEEQIQARNSDYPNDCRILDMQAVQGEMELFVQANRSVDLNRVADNVTEEMIYSQFPSSRVEEELKDDHERRYQRRQDIIRTLFELVKMRSASAKSNTAEDSTAFAKAKPSSDKVQEAAKKVADAASKAQASLQHYLKKVLKALGV